MSSTRRDPSLRVAFVTEQAGLGGGETSLLNLMQAAKDGGALPILVCPEGQLAARAATDFAVWRTTFDDVHLRWGMVPTINLSVVRSLARELERGGVDVVQVESLLGLYYGGLAAAWARRPCVATYHGYWPLGSRWLRAFLGLFCQRIFAVSASVASELRSHGVRTPIEHVPLGVGQRFLDPLPSKEEARQELALPQDRFLVLQAARFQAIKGQDRLLDALATPPLRHCTRCLVALAGGLMEPAASEERAYKAEMERRAASPELRDRVLLLGHRDNVPLLMRAADVVVTPSSFETFSMATIEAMVVGTPTVATSRGGPVELLEHGRTGLLVEPEPEALAAAIATLEGNPELGRALAAEAQRVAVGRYAPLARWRRVLPYYLEMCGRR